MIGEGVVAVFAGVVDAAAFHLDRDDVQRAAIVGAPGLGVEIDAMHGWRTVCHTNRVEDDAGVRRVE